MFFPKAMTEVEVIVPAKDLVAVTKVLGSRGNFQQIDSTYLGLALKTFSTQKQYFFAFIVNSHHKNFFNALKFFYSRLKINKRRGLY